MACYGRPGVPATREPLSLENGAGGEHRGAERQRKSQEGGPVAPDMDGRRRERQGDQRQ